MKFPLQQLAILHKLYYYYMQLKAEESTQKSTEATVRYTSVTQSMQNYLQAWQLFTCAKYTELPDCPLN